MGRIEAVSLDLDDTLHNSTLWVDSDSGVLKTAVKGMADAGLVLTDEEIARHFAQWQAKVEKHHYTIDLARYISHDGPLGSQDMLLLEFLYQRKFLGSNASNHLNEVFRTFSDCDAVRSMASERLGWDMEARVVGAGVNYYHFKKDQAGPVDYGSDSPSTSHSYISFLPESDVAKVLLHLSEYGLKYGILTSGSLRAQQWKLERITHRLEKAFPEEMKRVQEANMKHTPLAAAKLYHLFPYQVISEEMPPEVGRLDKPYPGIFTMLAAQMGVSPHKVAHVGDRIDNDVFGANLAGMVSIHYQNPTSRYSVQTPRNSYGSLLSEHRRLHDLEQAIGRPIVEDDFKPDYTITSLAELPDVLRTKV